MLSKIALLKSKFTAIGKTEIHLLPMLYYSEPFFSIVGHIHLCFLYFFSPDCPVANMHEHLLMDYIHVTKFVFAKIFKTFSSHTKVWTASN